MLKVLPKIIFLELYPFQGSIKSTFKLGLVISSLASAKDKLKIKTEVNTAPDYVQYLALPKKDDQSSSGQVSSSNSGRSLDSPRTPNQVQNKKKYPVQCH